MSRELAANVYVDGTLYEAGTTPPKDVAERITNPKAWGDTSPASDKTTPAAPPAPEPPAPAKKAAPKKTASSGR